MASFAKLYPRTSQQFSLPALFTSTKEENFWRKTFFFSSTIDIACCCHFFFGNKNFFSARRAKFHVITRVWNGSFSKPWYLHLPLDHTFHAERPECGGVNITCQFTLLSKTWQHEEDANFLSENNLIFFPSSLCYFPASNFPRRLDLMMLQWYDFIFFLLSFEGGDGKFVVEWRQIDEGWRRKVFFSSQANNGKFTLERRSMPKTMKKKQDIDTFRRYRRIHLILGDNSDDDAWTFPVITLIAMICKLPFSLARRSEKRKAIFSFEIVSQ